MSAEFCKIWIVAYLTFKYAYCTLIIRSSLFFPKKKKQSIKYRFLLLLSSSLFLTFPVTKFLQKNKIFLLSLFTDKQLQLASSLLTLSHRLNGFDSNQATSESKIPHSIGLQNLSEGSQSVSSFASTTLQVSAAV